MPKFVTLFPPAQNIHIAKDVGMIPCLMAREQGFDSTLVCFSRSEDMPYLTELAKPLKIHSIAQNAGYHVYRWPAQEVIRYLLCNAKSIDVLHMFHLNRETIIQSLVYKLLNNKGVVYIKLDYSSYCVGDERKCVLTNLNNYFKYLFRVLFIRLIPNLMTIETSTAYEYFIKAYPSSAQKLKIMPNGIDTYFLERNNFKRCYCKKENLIISVGRIGSYEKNSEMLLTSISMLDIKDWYFAFIGPIDIEFRNKLALLLLRMPELKDRIILTGNIESRVELYSWYARAKVFCLTSRRESFSLAMIDALYFGCYIVTTPVDSAADITGNGSLGSIVRSDTELCEVLHKIIVNEIDTEDKMHNIYEHSRKFCWSSICSDLASWLGHFLQRQVV